MAKINTNYLNLQGAYLFAEIAKRQKKFREENPGKHIISLGIGDVTRPLAPAVIDALHKAVDEMGTVEGFKGYAPYQGYDFLVDTIIENDYAGLGINREEIFVSDGAKSDMGNICDIFGDDNVVAVMDPVYPVYVDTNIMSGRKVVLIDAVKENGFTPIPDKNLKADLVYICSPNNPTGTVMNKEQLTLWVKWALDNKAIILFDSAYEAFITDKNLPRSIYEIDGARECAIEFRTFSKTAGFTGVRCGYSVVPKCLTGVDGNGNKVPLHGLWYRRYSTKYNGVPYIVQRAAEAVYSDAGKAQTAADIKYYLENAKIIKQALDELGYKTYGGYNSPYIWFEAKMASWDFFDLMLEKANIVCTPGVGFGKCGEGYVRMTAFGSRENTLEAARRIKKVLGNI